jgi:hypothetical protein
VWGQAQHIGQQAARAAYQLMQDSSTKSGPAAFAGLRRLDAARDCRLSMLIKRTAAKLSPTFTLVLVCEQKKKKTF